MEKSNIMSNIENLVFLKKKKQIIMLDWHESMRLMRWGVLVNSRDNMRSYIGFY